MTREWPPVFLGYFRVTQLWFPEFIGIFQSDPVVASGIFGDILE